MFHECIHKAWISQTFVRPLYFAFSLSLSLSLSPPSVTCQKDCILLSSEMLVRSGGPSLYILPWSCFDLAEDREQLFFSIFLSLPLFFFSSAARVSFACIVFEQCSVWTVRSQLRIQARSTDRLLSPAFPSDSINASVSLKKGDAANRQAHRRRDRQEWLQTKSVARLPQRADSPSFGGTDKAGPDEA